MPINIYQLRKKIKLRNFARNDLKSALFYIFNKYVIYLVLLFFSSSVPIQYIINEWNFRNLTLKMRPPVFVPWAETEQLIDVVLNDIPKDSTSTILELCCGSGAICLSILNERPHVTKYCKG